MERSHGRQPTDSEQRGPSDQSCPVGHYPPRRTLPPDVASALRAARQQSGLTNRDAAAQIGIDPSYLSKLVRGSRAPSSVVVEQLIAVLPLSEGDQQALRDAAVRDRGKSRPLG